MPSIKTINLNVFEACRYESIMIKLKDYGAKCDIKN